MRHVLLVATASLVALAASVTLAAPAAAIDPAGLSRAGSFHGVTVHRRSGFNAVDFRSDRDRRRHRGSDRDIYLGDRDYQGDTAWRPTGFNDWWHERPWRSEPRWLRSNNCERQYWTGGGWRC